MNWNFLYNLEEYIAIHRYRLIKAVLVYENGNLAFERYYNKSAPDSRNQIKSIWKSILSLTLGICLDKGIIQNVDEPIGRYLKPFDENSHPYHSFITIRSLLTMASGIFWNSGVHYHCPMMEQMRRSADWVSYIADVKMSDMPGSKFIYKEWDVLLLSALIGKACGGSSWDVCQEYLYEPLKITSGQWTQSKCGVASPSDGIDATSNLSARALAKIGLLMLNGGIWAGQRIISSKYIQMAQTPSKANNGYGFLWWLSDKGCHGRGFGGQELNVYTDENIVAVLQAGVTASSKEYADIFQIFIGS